MGIRQRVLIAFLLLLGGTLVPAALLVESWLGDELRDGVRESLEREATVLAADLEADEAPLAFVHRIAPHAQARITVIALDGRVLADSSVPDEQLGRLQNHAGRPEVKRALAAEVGSDARRSATLDEELMYVAVPVGNPPRLVLRLALPLAQVTRAVATVRNALLAAGGLALALAVALGLGLSRWLTRPTLEMTRAARAMAGGDFEVRLPPPSRDELGDLARALATLRDEHAARLGELNGERDKLRAVLDAMTEGVALVHGGRIDLANPAFARLLETPYPVEGRTPLEAARLPELADAVAAAARRRGPATAELKTPSRTVAARALPLVGAGDALVVLSDVTDERRLERLRREFVANASHELRTPVAAVVGAAETLAAGAAEDPAARASFLEILLRHAQRLSRLTEDLLDLSRLESGYRPRLGSVPLDAAAQVALATLRDRAEAKHIGLACEVGPELRAEADRAAVEQILTNLVDNAVKYTPDGGRVRVAGRRDGDRAVLTVEDSGPGIPAEHLPRLFERFYRIDSARSRELGGTGLGLAIVKHLAVANGGEVAVDSTVGKGTTFSVRLPAA